MTRSESAKQFFTSGYNCSQAVALAFADIHNVPRDIVERMTAPMGGGMGRLRETCGAVTGAFLSMGLLFPDLPKAELYALVQDFARRFKQKNGSYNCGELLAGVGIVSDRSTAPEARTAEYYKKRPCVELVGDAAEILEEMCKERGVL